MSLDRYVLNHQPNDLALLTLRLKQLPKYKLFTLHKPERIVIDFYDVNVRDTLKSLASKKGLVKSVRIGKRADKVSRLVLHVKPGVELLKSSFVESKGIKLVLRVKINKKNQYKGARGNTFDKSDQLIQTAKIAKPPLQKSHHTYRLWHYFAGGGMSFADSVLAKDGQIGILRLGISRDLGLIQSGVLFGMELGMQTGLQSRLALSAVNQNNLGGHCRSNYYRSDD